MVQVYKGPPYHPQNYSFDPESSLTEEDIAFLVESGFTAVRLFVAWPGVEPRKGVYNTTYLQVRSYILHFSQAHMTVHVMHYHAHLLIYMYIIHVCLLYSKCHVYRVKCIVYMQM